MTAEFKSSKEFREVMDRIFTMMDVDPDMGPKLRAADVPQRFEFVAVRSRQLANRMQPMVDKTPTSAIDGGTDAAAAIMSDHHDMLHFEYVDGKLEHR